MNFKYKVEEREIVLTPEEHQKVQEATSTGKTLIFLRNGTLALNISFIRWIKETDEMTEAQQKERDEVLKIAPERVEYRKDDAMRTGGGLQKLGEWVKKQEWSNPVPPHKDDSKI